jgi:hypothetical protein
MLHVVTHHDIIVTYIHIHAMNTYYYVCDIIIMIVLTVL